MTTRHSKFSVFVATRLRLVYTRIDFFKKIISEDQIEIIHGPILSESFEIKPMCVRFGLACTGCTSFFEKPIKPAVKSVQKRRPIICISLEPHFINFSPFRHHWSPFVTILSPPLLLFYSKFI